MIASSGLDADRAEVFPLGAGVSAAGHLTRSSVDVAALAACYGTPLYVYDEAIIGRST